MNTMELRRVSNWEIGNITDLQSRRDPLCEGILVPTAQGGDIKEVFVDKDDRIFILSNRQGLCHKNVYQTRVEMLFDVFGKPNEESKLVLKMLMNFRVENVTDMAGHREEQVPLDNLMWVRGSGGGDIEGVFADENGEKYILSKHFRLCSRRLYQSLIGLRFDVFGDPEPDPEPVPENE